MSVFDVRGRRKPRGGELDRGYMRGLRETCNLLSKRKTNFGPFLTLFGPEPARLMVARTRARGDTQVLRTVLCTYGNRRVCVALIYMMGDPEYPYFWWPVAAEHVEWFTESFDRALPQCPLGIPTLAGLEAAGFILPTANFADVVST